MLQVKTRREALVARGRRAHRRAALRRRRRPARLPARRLHSDRGRPERRARGLGALPAALSRSLPRPRAERAFLGRAAPPGRDHEYRQHPCPPAPRRGRLAQRRPLRASVALERRRQGQPVAVRARADQSALRLHRRWHALERHGKRRAIVAVAVARDFAAHCSALATMTWRASQRLGEQSAPATTRGATRETGYEQPRATLDPRGRLRSRSHTRSCGLGPRISAATTASTTYRALGSDGVRSAG